MQYSFKSIQVHWCYIPTGFISEQKSLKGFAGFFWQNNRTFFFNMFRKRICEVFHVNFLILNAIGNSALQVYRNNNQIVPQYSIHKETKWGQMVKSRFWEYQSVHWSLCTQINLLKISLVFLMLSPFSVNLPPERYWKCKVWQDYFNECLIFEHL